MPITTFSGKPIKTTRDLAMAVAETPSGHSASVAVWRDGHSQALNVNIRAEGPAKVASAADGSDMKPVGMSLEALTPDVRSQLNIASTASGVLVGQVTPGSSADDSGVQAGDVIERVAGSAVSTPEQVVDAIRVAERQKKEAVSMLIMRQGVASYLGLQLQA